MAMFKSLAQKVVRKINNILCCDFCLQKVNALHPLTIKTYDGGNEGLHPACLYFSNGWNGYKFWFVFTPYKNMNDAIENPCVYVSQDGECFEPLDGANPLDDILLSKEQEYNSDPELVFNSDLNRIECWWRRVQRDEYPTAEGKNREIIYRRYTYDGKTWSGKEVMLNLKNPFNETRLCISPALIYENGIYHMWCSSAEDFEGKYRTINYYEWVDGKSPKLKCKHMVSKGIISHIDVVKADDKYWLVGNDVSTEGFPLRLYSFDSPFDEEYKYEGVVLSKGKCGQWDERVIYRPSAVFVEDNLWLYYSAYGSNPNTKNHVGLIKTSSWKQLQRCFLRNRIDGRC